MSTPTRRPPALLRAAAVIVALFALIGFVAAAGAGDKSNSVAADAGVVRKKVAPGYFPASKSAGGMHFRSEEKAGDGGAAAKKKMFFPASKSAGDFFPERDIEGKEEPLQLSPQQSPAQQVQQR